MRAHVEIAYFSNLAFVWFVSCLTRSTLSVPRGSPPDFRCCSSPHPAQRCVGFPIMRSVTRKRKQERRAFNKDCESEVVQAISPPRPPHTPLPSMLRTDWP
jgi:hypothetical protein